MADPKIQIVLAVKDEATGGLKQVENQFVKSLGGIKSNADGLAGALNPLKNALTGLGVAISVGGFASFSKSVLDAGLQAESLDKAFKAIAGSGQAAKTELRFIQQEADRLGLNFYKVAQSYKGIFAASQGTGAAGQGVREIFSAVSEAGMALGLSADDVDGALRAIGQSMSKGKVMAEELRGQLGERLPGAFNIMARALGVSTAQLDKMLQSGSVGADAWQKFAQVLHGTYGGSVSESANTVAARINKLDESWTKLKINFFNTAAIAGVADVFDKIAKSLETASNKVDEYNQLSKLDSKDYNERFFAVFDRMEGMSAKPFAFWKALFAAQEEVKSSLKDTSAELLHHQQLMERGTYNEKTANDVKKITDEYKKLATARSDAFGRGIGGRLADQEKALNAELQKGIQLRDAIKALDDGRSDLFKGLDQSAENLDSLQAQLDEINSAMAERRAGPSVGMFGDMTALTRERDMVLRMIADEQENTRAIQQQVELNDKLISLKSESLRISEQQAQVRQGEEIQGLVLALQQRMETGSISDAETQRVITSILEKRTKLEGDLNAKLGERDDLMVRMTALSGMAGYDATADKERARVLDESISKMREWIDGAQTSTQGVTDRIMGLNDALKAASDQNMAIIDKQISDANAKYGSVVDFVRTNPIVIDADIDPLRDKLQSIISEIQRMQSQVSGGFQGIRTSLQEMPSDWDFTMNFEATGSPTMSFSNYYQYLVGKLSSLPKGSSYTLDVLMQQGMSGASAANVAQSYDVVRAIKSQIAQAKDLAFQYNLGHTHYTSMGKSAMADYYEKLVPKLQNQLSEAYSKLQYTLAGASYDSGGSSSGGTSVNVSVGPIQIQLTGSGNSRDDVITLADRIDEEIAIKIKGNRSQIKYALGLS